MIKFLNCTLSVYLRILLITKKRFHVHKMFHEMTYKNLIFTHVQVKANI